MKTPSASDVHGRKASTIVHRGLEVGERQQIVSKTDHRSYKGGWEPLRVSVCGPLAVIQVFTVSSDYPPCTN